MDLLTELLGDATTDVVRPRPFGAEAVGALAGHVLGLLEPEFGDALAAAGGGNPLFVREAALALHREAVAPTTASAHRITAVSADSLARAERGDLPLDLDVALRVAAEAAAILAVRPGRLRRRPPTPGRDLADRRRRDRARHVLALRIRTGARRERPGCRARRRTRHAQRPGECELAAVQRDPGACPPRSARRGRGALRGDARPCSRGRIGVPVHARDGFPVARPLAGRAH